MDPCRDVRHEVITSLLQRKTQILREAEEGGKVLQEEARRAFPGAAQEAAFAKWNLFRREVLFAAHARAQKIDLQVYEIMQAPCSEVFKQARNLGIHGALEEQQEAGELPPPGSLALTKDPELAVPAAQPIGDQWQEEREATAGEDETAVAPAEPAVQPVAEGYADGEEGEEESLTEIPLPVPDLVEPGTHLRSEQIDQRYSVAPVGAADLPISVVEQIDAASAGHEIEDDEEEELPTEMPVPDPAERGTRLPPESTEQRAAAATEVSVSLPSTAEEQIRPDPISLMQPDERADDEIPPPLPYLAQEQADSGPDQQESVAEAESGVHADQPDVTLDQAEVEPKLPEPRQEPAVVIPLPEPAPVDEQIEVVAPASEMVTGADGEVPPTPSDLAGEPAEVETHRPEAPETDALQTLILSSDLAEGEIEAALAQREDPLVVTREQGAHDLDQPDREAVRPVGDTDVGKPETPPAARDAVEQTRQTWKRRFGVGLPMWLVALLGGLAGVVATTVVVVLLLNRGGGWKASQTPATPSPPTATSAATAGAVLSPTAMPVVIATHAPTSLPSPTRTSVPSPAAQVSPTPVPEPTSTSTPSLTPSAIPTAASTRTPTLVPAPTSTGTPPPTATPATPQVLVDGTYNLRSGPGTNYPLAGQVQAGQRLEIVGQNPAGIWWQICCVQGEQAWILASLAPSEGPASSVGVVADIPPAPEPTPAAESGVDVVPETLSGKIAFPVFDQETQTYDLYVSNPDGSVLQWLLDEASQPTFSPDGQRIALRRWWGGGRGMAVINSAGGDLQTYTDGHEDALPSWGVDGRSLVFSSRKESDRRSRIYRVDLLSRSISVITRDTLAVYGEIANQMADGSIVYRVTWPEAGLAVMNGDGSGERMIAADGSATAPAGSPDGSVIAYMSYRDGNWEIYRVNMDGSGVQRLTDDPANDGLPAWSPDGQTIAFVSDRDGTWAMWAMTAGGQGHRQLFSLPGSPDGIVLGEMDYSSKGWMEERVSWGP